MYTKEERALRAEWISPCDDALAALDRPRAAGFPDADWIWPLGCTRFHAFRLFTPKNRCGGRSWRWRYTSRRFRCAT